MKILIVHQYYLPPGEPGGSRFNELAKQWTRLGHDVTVVAGNRNYSTGRANPLLTRALTMKAMDGSVHVYWCRVPGTYLSGALGRMWAFAGFVLTSTLAAVRTPRADVVITTSPPLTVAVTGWLITRLRHRRARWVFEVRDLWPESAISTGVLSRGSWLTRRLYALEASTYRHCDLISVLTPAFKENIRERNLAPAEKLAVIPNGADVDLFKPSGDTQITRGRLGWDKRFVALYAGAHGRANAIHQLVHAAEHLRDREDILIVTVGDGPERQNCEEMARHANLSNIVFLGPRAKTEMPELVAASDAGIAVLQSNPTFRTVYPNKVFDYMSCAKPVILAIDGVARQLVCNQAGAGVFATPEDGREIAEQVRWLADNRNEVATMGARGRAWVLKHASREALGREYLRILEELVSCTRNSENAASM